MTRARDLGITVGALPPGRLNAITDVEGVRVGHTTIQDPPDLHTGVTAILPTQLSAVRRSLPAALAVGNGYGKLIGATQIDELGEIETPILLTATLSAFRVADALVSYVLSQPGYQQVTSLNPVVGETNDAFLSDIRRRPITEQHVRQALTSATDGLPAEGCVGAGTGTSALGFKGGIGTASRLARVDGRDVSIGALVQSNFSGTLTVSGTPAAAEELLADPGGPVDIPGNSCMIILAVDAPLDARQLGRIARRGLLGLDRVGSDFAGGSGDYALAFTTAEAAVPVRDATLNELFVAAIDSVEEALLNSLLAATTTVGFGGHIRHALPPDRLLARLANRTG